MSADDVVVVSGPPRSGTSLMMQMLQAGGLPVLTDGRRGADENNPRGYLEFEPVKRLRSDTTWLPQARGRVVKVIHLLLRELPRDAALRYRVVFMDRPPAEVLASQQAMLARDGSAAGDVTLLRKAHDRQLVQLRDWLPTRPDIALVHVAYHDLLRDPVPVAEAVSRFLGRTLDTGAMARAVDPALHRQRSGVVG